MSEARRSRRYGYAERVWLEPMALKIALVKANTSIGVVARDLGLPKATLWLWARAKNSAPISEVERLAAHIGVKVREILEPEQADLFEGQTKTNEDREAGIS